MFFETIPVNEYIKGVLNGHGFNSHQFQSIRGRVVEGTGLIIRFPIRNVTGSNPVGCKLIIFLYCFFCNLIVRLLKKLIQLKFKKDD